MSPKTSRRQPSSTPLLPPQRRRRPGGSGCSLDAAGVSGQEFLSLIRQRRRYDWLADKVDRWVGLYNVAELVELLESNPTLPGQHQKALVALSRTDDLSALAALEDLDTSKYSAEFQSLHQIAVGQWRQRRRMGTASPNHRSCF